MNANGPGFRGSTICRLTKTWCYIFFLRRWLGLGGRRFLGGLFLEFGGHRQKGGGADVSGLATTRDGGDYADLIAILERRALVIEKTDVFLIDEDVHKAANFAGLVQQSLFHSWEFVL